MSFLKDLGQNIGQTMSNVAETVVERGQHLSAQAQLQLSLKKLQMERTRRLQELGRLTYSWYQSGNLVTTGSVPTDVTETCRQIERITYQLDDTQRRLEELKIQMQEAGIPDTEVEDAAPVVTTTSLSTLPDDTAPAADGSTQPPIK